MEHAETVRKGTGNYGLVVAFLAGAGVAATAILLTAKACNTPLIPTADRLLKKCSKAVRALDRQIA